MWTREDLKTKAKAVLKLNYGQALFISIVLILIGGDSGQGISSSSTRANSNNIFSNATERGVQWVVNLLPDYSYVIIAFIICFAYLCYRILLGYAVEVGGRRFFIQSAQMDINMSYLGYAFGNGRYINVVKTMFYRGILNLLWYLLLIIPGIVKSYAYSMVPYILADNPNIDYSRAVELSNQMTEGQKFEMFVLDLSFIGWYLLGMLLFYVGVIFVKPYENATKAELYLTLRNRAIEHGFCMREELLIGSTL